MDNIEELKTLIILSGNKRLPDLEEEIFSNKELTNVYLRELFVVYPDKDFYIHNSHHIDTLVYTYAKHIIRGPWPEVEHIIINTDNGYWWKHYLNWFNLKP